jgi:hypothetical protein
MVHCEKEQVLASGITQQKRAEKGPFGEVERALGFRRCDRARTDASIWRLERR